jgi:hypothetical protein
VIRLRSVGAQLSLALLAIVAAGLAFVYLIVVPSLEERLVEGKLDQLAEDAPGLAQEVRFTDVPIPRDVLEDASDRTNARALILEPLDGDVLNVKEDSRGAGESSAYGNDPVAKDALTTQRLTRGTVEHEGERFAEVAYPIVGPDARVLLLSASLGDQLETGRVRQVPRCPPPGSARASSGRDAP